MRNAGLALALVATTQLTLLSSPAFADGASASASVSIGGSGASASASTSGSGAGSADDSKKDSSKITTGWVLVGVGSAVGITGIILDVVGANSGTVAGEGGPGDASNTDNTRTDFYFLGTTLIVAGLVTGLYGGSMVWSGNNGKDTAPSERSEKEQDEAKIDGVTQAVQARTSSAPKFVVPLVSATF
jgi:hypothetical protein